MSHRTRTSTPITPASTAALPKDQKDLALTTIGKLAALIEWLTPQHKSIATLLEQGNSALALARLGEVLSAWHQIQTAYGNLAKLVGITMNELRVHDGGGAGGGAWGGVTGEIVLNEFCNQLSEMQTSLKNHDLVLLADILQYEMDGAAANWMSLLEATLAIVEPQSAAA
jgi:hypothetical protein